MIRRHANQAMLMMSLSRRGAVHPLPPACLAVLLAVQGLWV